IILVLGETGSGKSSFINTISPNSVEVGHDLTAYTQVPESVEVDIDDRVALLVDTPGFNDTHRSDTQILWEIARTLISQMELGAKLRGVLYLYDISAARMTGSSLRQLSLIEKICGPEAFDNVFLVTTKWASGSGTLDRFQAAYPIREGDLRRQFWNPMIKKGAKMVRFNGTVGSA
ncbi:P-loop containing nucleoside triphosphate hydrolase protein, partial [Wilcoxina mikolae CBS 423.85]